MRTATVARINTTEIDATAGLMLSRSPIHISRGRVMASTLVMKSVTPISSQESTKDSSGRTVVDGLDLARMAKQNAVLPADPSSVRRSARNRFVGIVTDIVMDTVMAQVELQCGPHRVVSLISSEAVRELGLELGSVAVAVVKATNVIVETAEVEE